jgi:N-acyl-D-amino-acid deacylase
MASRILIKNGTVVDGNGMPAYKADLRSQGDEIVEVGRNLSGAPGERVFDASGEYLTPAFIARLRRAAADPVREVWSRCEGPA